MTNHIKALCHQGVIRSNNEDAIKYGVNEALGFTWMIIADGMGGHNAGEVASAMLVNQISKAVEPSTFVKPSNWQNWIIEQLNLANIAIFQASQENPAQQGMGTTGVLVIIENNRGYIGWVGDSRLYLLKEHELVQQTVDHTMLQELVNKGAISAETAKNANTKNLLSQAIGVSEKISVDTTTITINNSDTIMLSTDGLHDHLTEQEISCYLSQSFTNENICNDMINKAISNKSRDNLTVGLINIVKSYS
ncbi:Stp1/IreP family PP2C-type Ser/Thr phosphatase [Colwellia sp. E2M01]|uniref:Stp1/IreP family PP2C-type Ser/Thr phosphatase n=1 Tax=Colwellia sp. E2M01 TaxID=2841561 RepID=UPI001C0A0C6B|nr:Stp1/IreP family PP2C-type Ser/Thr phosphatase [Colwellia sp. E2M01]MBU2871351.1 Stp1/IreP family PP2C-type Ser/Thr phosphatase [Colwellia sp. E2M01]